MTLAPSFIPLTAPLVMPCAFLRLAPAACARAQAMPSSALAELGVVRRCYPSPEKHMTIMTKCIECGEQKPALRPVYLPREDVGLADSGSRICEDCLRKSKTYRACTYCSSTVGYRREDLMPLTIKDRTYLYCPECFEEVLKEEQRRPLEEERQQSEQDEQDYGEYLDNH